MTQLEEFIGETDEHMSALEKDEQLYRSWSESNTKKRVLEWLLGKKEKDRLQSRITDVI
jgi:flagellar biosynthesis chaperone FliJ